MQIAHLSQKNFQKCSHPLLERFNYINSCKPNAALSEGSPPAAPVLDTESALSVLHGDTLKLIVLLVSGLVLGNDLKKVLYQKVYFKLHKQDSSEVFPNHVLMQNGTAVSLSNERDNYLDNANEDRSVKMS